MSEDNKDWTRDEVMDELKKVNIRNLSRLDFSMGKLILEWQTEYDQPRYYFEVSASSNHAWFQVREDGEWVELWRAH